MARPARKTSYVRINLTLRAEDAEHLRELAYSLFADKPESAVASLRRGERPGASMAVRYLLDDQRERRAMVALSVREDLRRKGQVAPRLEDIQRLLDFDPVFGDPERTPATPEEVAFATAYAAKMASELSRARALARAEAGERQAVRGRPAVKKPKVGK